MKIKQFEDQNLAHYSYAIVSAGEMALIDPARDPKPYYEFAEKESAEITAVIETHPHADFVSSHLEIHRDTDATIYVSEKLGASYPHEAFDEGDSITLGDVALKAWNTPGHSADSITVILEDENGKDSAAFTGDTLFIGDCGRPDLREKVGNIQQKREEQARQMYHSLKKFHRLADDVLVYPAHGAGSLCGKGLSEDSQSTIGREKEENWSLQPMSEDEFVKTLTEGQPFIPKYFVYDVDINRKGAAPFGASIANVAKNGRAPSEAIDPGYIIIDARSDALYKKGHLKGAINIPADEKQFETWLGTLIAPEEDFYLIAGNQVELDSVVERVAKIGYEPFVKQALVLNEGPETEFYIDMDHFIDHEDRYTILDVRAPDEVEEEIFFKGSINIPLDELRERADELPTDKPIAVHCAGGYRSAIGTSIIHKQLPDAEVYDISEEVEKFKKEEAV